MCWESLVALEFPERFVWGAEYCLRLYNVPMPTSLFMNPGLFHAGDLKKSRVVSPSHLQRVEA